MAKLLPCKHENLSLVPRTHIKKLDVAVSAHCRALRGKQKPLEFEAVLGYRVGNTRPVKVT